MDRNLHVLKNDILFAELVFNYQTQVLGEVWITIYGHESVVGGISPIFPLVTYPATVSHPALNSIAEIEQFDREFFAAQPAPPIPEGMTDSVLGPPDAMVTFVYQNVHYRYVLNHPFVGIADIYSNFTGNTKKLQFISGSSISFDGSLTTDSIECNVNFCTRFCEATLQITPAEFLRLGWR